MTQPNSPVFQNLLDIRPQIVDARATNDTLAETVYSPAGTPFWESPFDGDDVYYPWAVVAAELASTAGALELMPIVIRQDRTVDVVRVATAVSSSTSVYVGLYKFDRATGITTKVFDSGNIVTDYNATYRTGSIVSVPMTPITVTRGEAYAVALLQVGGTPGAFYTSLAYSPTTLTFPVGPTYPEALSGRVDPGHTTLPSTANLSGADFSDRNRHGPWAALGVAALTPPSPANYSDSFNRNSPSNLGNMWTHRYRSGGSGELIIANSELAPPNTNTNDHLSTYIPNLRSDDHRVGMRYGTNPPRRLYLPLRSSDSNQCFAKWDVQNGTANIYTSTSWGITGTSRASDTAPTTFKTMAFQAEGTLYTLTCISMTDEQVDITWDDTGVLHPVGTTQRVAGVGLAGNGTNTTRGFAEDWYAQDLA